MPTTHFIRHVCSSSTNTIGTDGLNALMAIAGISSPEILEESGAHVIISYDWDANANPPDNPEAYFSAFGLQKIA